MLKPTCSLFGCTLEEIQSNREINFSVLMEHERKFLCLHLFQVEIKQFCRPYFAFISLSFNEDSSKKLQRSLSLSFKDHLHSMHHDANKTQVWLSLRTLSGRFSTLGKKTRVILQLLTSKFILERWAEVQTNTSKPCKSLGHCQPPKVFVNLSSLKQSSGWGAVLVSVQNRAETSISVVV